MNSIIDLTNKTFLVTGAGSGIGRETAKVLSEQGAKVILLDLNQEGLDKTLSLLVGEGHLCKACDLTDFEALPALVKEIIEQCGSLDGFVHCAGISSRKPLNVLRPSRFSKVMDVNFYSFEELTRLLTKKGNMKDGGSIVVMSSISSINGYKAKTEYCVSKAAVDAFVRCMAQELAPKQIRINSVMPVGVDTPMGRRAAEMADSVGASNEAVALVRPVEIANTIAFLLSDAVTSISGAAIPILMPQVVDNEVVSTPPLSICEPIGYDDCYCLIGKKILLVNDHSAIDEVILQRLVECGANVICYTPESIDNIEADMKWMSKEYGGIDGLIYGIVHSDFRPLQFVKPDIVNQITADNYGLFVEVMRCLRKSKGLNERASIVALSSISSIRAMKAKMAFCASKAALDAAVRCLAVELADKKIRVNTIQKGVVDADFEKSHIQDIAAINEGAAEKNLPLGVTSAKEIANSVVFLLSDATRTITGTSILIDGGYTL